MFVKYTDKSSLKLTTRNSEKSLDETIKSIMKLVVAKWYVPWKGLRHPISLRSLELSSVPFSPLNSA